MDDFIHGRHRGKETKEHAAVLYLVVTVSAKQEWRAFIKNVTREAFFKWIPARCLYTCTRKIDLTSFAW
jgi:hypothetical protein